MGGQGRCLDAEVRPYSELAECLSSLCVKEVGEGGWKGEKQLWRAGGGFSVGEGPAPALGSQETHQPFTNPQGVGGRRSNSFAQRRAPLITLARDRTFSLLCAPFPKLFPATQQARCYFHYPQMRTLRLGPVKLTAQGCSLTSGSSPGSRHCSRS